MPASCSSIVERGLELEDGLLARGTLGRHLLGQLAVLVRLQELERQVFQLRLDAGHAEPVRQRRVDLAGLQRDPGSPLRRQVLQRPHVVEPVAQLDDDDAGVLGDRQQELAVVLDLLLGRGAEGEAGDLGEAVHDAGDLGAELPGDVLHPHVGVLDHVVQQRGRDGGAVQQLLGQDQRDGDGVGDEVFARHPLLAPVRGRAEAERPVDQLEVEPVGVPLEHGPEVGQPRSGQGCSGHSSPAAAKLTNRSPAMMTWSYTGRSSSWPADDQLLGDRPVFRRGGRIAAGMVVHHDDSRRRLGDGGPEHFPRMHQRAVQQPAGDQHLAQHLALAVQRQQVELLDLQVPQPGAKQPDHILGLPDPLHRAGAPPAQPGAQLEGGEQAPRLGGTDARRPQQLGAGPLGQPAQATPR